MSPSLVHIIEYSVLQTYFKILIWQFEKCFISIQKLDEKMDTISVW